MDFFYLAVNYNSFWYVVDNNFAKPGKDNFKFTCLPYYYQLCKLLRWMPILWMAVRPSPSPKGPKTIVSHKHMMWKIQVETYHCQIIYMSLKSCSEASCYLMMLSFALADYAQINTIWTCSQKPLSTLWIVCKEDPCWIDVCPVISADAWRCAASKCLSKQTQLNECKIHLGDNV